MSALIDVLPFVILTSHFIDKYYLSRGVLLPVYILTIIGSLSTAAFNVLLYVEQGRVHGSILLFSANSLFSIAMSVKGLIRLCRENSTPPTS